ncbi:MAG TPA: class I SAM-dependent methyltransferase [Fimbriimonadaceae bacterium]|nr:class I SAM-dependent methyltransferase [Fimbriimonadaceae bacterium]
MGLTKVSLLDVSTVGEVGNSVWIPFTELKDRLFELPAPVEPLRIADNCADAVRAVEFLSAGGRAAVLESRFGSSQSPERNRLWSPNPWVENATSHLSIGTVLDLGCGSGRDLVYLGDLGWTGLGVDHLPSAVRQGQLLAQRYGVRTVQFASQVPEQAFDLCLLMFVPVKDLLPTALARSRHHLVIEGFTPLNFQRHGKPASKFQVSKADLSGLELVEVDEAWRENGTHTFRGVVKCSR